jgi:hypothetical protein
MRDVLVAPALTTDSEIGVVHGQLPDLSRSWSPCLRLGIIRLRDIQSSGDPKGPLISESRRI